MEYVLLVYAFLKLELLNDLLSSSSIILGVGLVIIGVVVFFRAIDNYYEDEPIITLRWKPTVKIISWTFGIVSILSVILPSQKQAAILVATYYTASVVQSPEVQKVVTLAKSMANNALDEAIAKTQKK
jgi:amino acid transporter